MNRMIRVLAELGKGQPNLGCHPCHQTSEGRDDGSSDGLWG
jgi:hypothetical protein